jgi:uncharacterized protein YjiS (DUF1127 family)
MTYAPNAVVRCETASPIIVGKAYFYPCEQRVVRCKRQGAKVAYRKFSDDLWSMAVNVAGGSQGNLSLQLVDEKQGLLRMIASRVREAGKRFGEQYRAYARYRETFDELASLDDRQLADIGVKRAELHRIVALAALDDLSARA